MSPNKEGSSKVIVSQQIPSVEKFPTKIKILKLGQEFSKKKIFLDRRDFCVEFSAYVKFWRFLNNLTKLLCRFQDGTTSGQFESAPWRTKILADLKQRHNAETSSFEKYEVAVEM